MEDLSNLLLLSERELIEEYKILFENYQQVRASSDADAQRIHELKRQLETANAAQKYLANELEQLTASTSLVDAATNSKEELAELRCKHNLLSNQFEAQQQDYESALNENSQLRCKLEAAEKQRAEAAKSAAFKTIECEHAEQLNLLEIENMELLQKLAEFQENDVRYTMCLAEREKNIEILRDQVNCLEENMRYKRDELEEKTQLLESTQEQLAEANAKIAMLTSAPENIDRKGNSLFAEVDDQRQAMKQLLAAQKKSYMEMKKVYNESQFEIRRLKRENVAMHSELQSCSLIFCNADKTYQNQLNKRIHYLLNENEELERKHNLTLQRMKELASEKRVDWLEPMLNFCKQETDDLKKQLYSVRIQNAGLDEQLRNTKQDMARWRFESLKSRCILLDRENLLNDNKISFKPMNGLEFNITANQLETARPRIASAVPKNVLKIVKQDAISIDVDSKQTNEEKQFTAAESEIITPIESITNMPTNIKLDPEQIENNEDKENINQSQIETELENVVKTAIPQSSPLTERTQKLTESDNVFMKNLTLEPAEHEKPFLRDITAAVPSILCKNHNIFAEKSQKHVKFSTSEATVHNVSTVKVEDAVGNVSVTETPNPQTRTKSNIIVRRFFINSTPNNQERK